MKPHGISQRGLAFAALALAALLVAPAPALAIMRQTVLTRAGVWVAYGVPYSQAGWANSYGVLAADSRSGWRRDCSGFISMAADLRYSTGGPLSLDTSTLPLRMNPIAKDSLMPGDVIMRPKNQPGAAYGHAVLFVRWADPSRTKYVGYHESSSAGKAVQATITYPFGTATGFAPYRLRCVEGTMSATAQIRRPVPPPMGAKKVWP